MNIVTIADLGRAPSAVLSSRSLLSLPTTAGRKTSSPMYREWISMKLSIWLAPCRRAHR